jgi:hypothetical protein
MTITYNPKDGYIYAVRMGEILYDAPAPRDLTLVELLEHLLKELKDGKKNQIWKRTKRFT